MIRPGDRIRLRDGVADAEGVYLSWAESYFVVVRLDGDRHVRKVKWSEIEAVAQNCVSNLIDSRPSTTCRCPL